MMMLIWSETQEIKINNQIARTQKSSVIECDHDFSGWMKYLHRHTNYEELKNISVDLGSDVLGMNFVKFWVSCIQLCKSFSVIFVRTWNSWKNFDSNQSNEI